MAGIDLDRPESYQQVDRHRMIDQIVEMDRQAEDAWRLSQQLDPRPDLRGRRGVLVLGMGGSAIGGDLVRTIVAGRAAVPVLVFREYDLPAFAGPDTLIIASSYSGNTEETLGTTRQALDRGAPVVAVTTGGQLAGLVEQAGYPVVRFSYPAQPRAALGYSLFLLLGILVRLGYLDASAVPLESALAEIRRQTRALGPEVPAERNPGKQLARDLQGALPIVYGGGILAEVARRWKSQLNENAKTWAFFEQLPELNHNAVMGYQFPPAIASAAFVVLLSSPLNHPRLRLREEVTAELLARHGVRHRFVVAEGESELAQLCSAIVFGDFVSYYLALLNGIDPSTIEAIDYLKAQLAAR